MTRRHVLKHQFVECIPDVLDDGVIYISVEYATMSHRCCCGCGTEVVTPLTPTDWKVTFDGETVSVHPSIGNWSFPCQSHYWISHNRIKWAEHWSKEQIELGRTHDLKNKEIQFQQPTKTTPPLPIEPKPNPSVPSQPTLGFWSRLVRGLRGK